MSNELNTILAYSADDINGLDSKGLIAAYNALAASLNKKSVNRFADRATGQKRLSALIEEARAAAPKAEPVNVTDAEFIALQTCLNYDTREAQLSDNYSNGGHDAFKKALGWNDQAVAALIGSLESKGLAYSDNEGVNGNKFNTVWLTEKGVNVVFDLIDAGRKAEAPKAKAEPKAKRVITYTYTSGEAPSTKSYFINAVYGLVSECVEREALVERVVEEVAPPRSQQYDRNFVLGYLAHMVQQGWLVKTVA